MKKSSPLLEATAKGFWCESGGFYIDPWQPVSRALITHAHADHFSYGCGSYLVSSEGLPVFRKRLGATSSIQTLSYGQKLDINGVIVSFHPAGHILGSAQIRLEKNGEVWVITGDYKTEPDKTCAPFELVKCHHFITEATFGLPIYHWQPQAKIFDEIDSWWAKNKAQGKASIIYAYALGKSQRLIAGVDSTIGNILTHGSVESLNAAYREAGIALPQTLRATQASKEQILGSLIIAPISARSSSWVTRFGTHSSAYASGWMNIRGARRRRAMDRGFILSDHADWESLLNVIRGTEAETVGVTHGYTASLSRYLNENGLAKAYPINTRYSDEYEDAIEAAQNEGESE